MIYAGYMNEEVAEMLPQILAKAKINPDRKVQYDYSSFETDAFITNEDRVRISRFELLDRIVSTKIFIIVPINQYFGRHQYIHALKMLKQNYTMIFITEEQDFLVMHNNQVFSKSKNLPDILFKIENSNLRYVNPYTQALTEVLDGNWKLANKYVAMLKTNTKFKTDIEMLFNTIDATVAGKELMIQKLIYVLQFTKYQDSYMLKETFGDDALYKAETVMSNWKQKFNVHMDPNDIAIVYEAELIDIEIIDRMVVQQDLNQE